MDFIFIIGPSAVGKTTLAKSLYQHYNGVYLEQNMVPEFVDPEMSKMFVYMRNSFAGKMCCFSLNFSMTRGIVI